MASARHHLGLLSTLLIVVLASACATPSGVVAAKLDHDRPDLKHHWLFAQNESGDVRLGEYFAANIGPRENEELPAYGFTVRHHKAPSWNVVGVGRLLVRRMKMVVVEHVELASDVAGVKPWLLDLHSSEAFQLVGALKTAGEHYDVASVSSGAVLAGEEYGSDAICFLRGQQVEAAVEFGDNDSATVRVRPGMDPTHESVLAAAATAVTLRRHQLRETGAAARGKKEMGLGDTICTTNMHCDNGVARKLVDLQSLPGL